MDLDRKKGDRERRRWDQVRGWRRQGRGRNPVGEEVTELGDGRDLFVVGGIGSVYDGTQKKVERMDYAVGGGHGRLGEVAVEELNCVGEKKMLGDGIDYMEASVVLECRANVEALVATEVQ